jgi:multidrug resistance efflux pump
MAVNFDGEIKARVVEIRFALSGKIASVSKHTGDAVKKWNLVASLDRKNLQTELDKQLSDYEKVRADWEIFGQKNPNPTEAIDKYLKTEKNAGLNVSVKEVELAKARLDQADLFSPVDGIIIEDSGIVPGLYVTPASGSIKIIDTSSYYFEFEIDQKNIHDFAKPRKCKVEIEVIKGTIDAETGQVFSDGKKFCLRIPITSSDGYLLGMKGKAIV